MLLEIESIINCQEMVNLMAKHEAKNDIFVDEVKEAAQL